LRSLQEIEPDFVEEAMA